MQKKNILLIVGVVASVHINAMTPKQLAVSTESISIQQQITNQLTSYFNNGCMRDAQKYIRAALGSTHTIEMYNYLAKNRTNFGCNPLILYEAARVCLNEKSDLEIKKGLEASLILLIRVEQDIAVLKSLTTGYREEGNPTDGYLLDRLYDKVIKWIYDKESSYPDTLMFARIYDTTKKYIDKHKVFTNPLSNPALVQYWGTSLANLVGYVPGLAYVPGIACVPGIEFRNPDAACLQLWTFSHMQCAMTNIRKIALDQILAQWDACAFKEVNNTKEMNNISWVDFLTQQKNRIMAQRESGK